MRIATVSAVMTLALLWGMQGRAAGEEQTYIAPGFQFNQVDAVCVMPAIDKKPDPRALLDGEAVRPLVMLALEERGYAVNDPSCAEGAHAGRSSAGSSRWLLTLTFDGYWMAVNGQVLGGFLTASLFDTQAGKEVWRNSASTRSRARFMNALMGAGGINYGVTDPVGFKTEVFKSALGPLLGKLEKRGKMAAPLATTSWAPISLRAGIFLKAHGKVCDGTLEAKAATVSFTSDRSGGRCQKYQFNVARNEIKSYGGTFEGSGIPVAFKLTVKGAGTIHFCGANERNVNYLFASLGSGR
jgi:hypothetical protein